MLSVRQCNLSLQSLGGMSPVRGVVAGGVTGAVTAGGGALELLGPPGVRPPAPGAERKTEKN